MKRHSDLKQCASKRVDSCIWGVVAGAMCTLAAPAMSQVQAQTSMSSDGIFRVTTSAISQLAPSTFDVATLTAYPGWTGHIGTGGGGVFNTTRYETNIAYDPDMPNLMVAGAILNSTYTRTQSLEPSQELQLIQTVKLNQGSTTNTYLDPGPRGNSLPYYWTKQQIPDYRTSSTVSHIDTPYSKFPSLANGDVTFTAQTYAVATTSESQNFTVLDGMSWGYKFELAKEGVAQASFANATCDKENYAVCYGDGNKLTFAGNIDYNRLNTLTFHDKRITPVVGTTFELGYLELFNSSEPPPGGITEVELNLETYFGFDGEYGEAVLISGLMRIEDALGQVKISFTDGSFSASLLALEDQVTRVALLGKISTVGEGAHAAKQVGDIVFDSGYAFEFAGFGTPVVVSSVPEISAFHMHVAGLVAIFMLSARSAQRSNVRAITAA